MFFECHSQGKRKIQFFFKIISLKSLERMIFCYTFALAFAINFAFAFKSCSLKDLHRQRSSTRSVRFFERTGK